MEPVFFYNHLGYLPSRAKKALLAHGDAQEFSLFSEDGSEAWRAPLRPLGNWEGIPLLLANFSACHKPGRYFLQAGSCRTALFSIGEEWLKGEWRLAQKSYYYQRCGIALESVYAGPYARETAHDDTALEFHPSMNRSGLWNAHGGWYDAGDYGKYIVNAGVSVSTLLLAYELYPQALADDDLGIPESGNGIPDLLDEVRWELDWFLRMQDLDGGFFFKVAPERWDGFMVPAQTHWPRRILDKSTTSSLNGAAALAQAARIYAPWDAAFAATCLEAARRAFEWALSHPAVSFPPYTEGSGAYGDDDYQDEFLWAQAMLWRATQDPIYRKGLENLLDRVPALPSVTWRYTGNLAYAALALQNDDIILRDRCQAALTEQALALRAQIEASPLRCACSHFHWGSNGDLMNRAMTLALDYEWSGCKESLDAMTELLDYVNGRNALELCFVTGASPRSPRHIHHRISAGDSVEEPVPGLLAGGVNSDKEDSLERTPFGVDYPHSAPGLCYYDHVKAFASNEIAINWNAPLVFVLAALREKGSAECKVQSAK